MKEPSDSYVRHWAKRACWAAFRNRRKLFRGEAINWGDFGPVEFTWIPGAERWRIVCEEANPDCPQVQEYIRAFLAKRGIDAEIRTEW